MAKRGRHSRKKPFKMGHSMDRLSRFHKCSCIISFQAPLLQRWVMLNQTKGHPLLLQRIAIMQIRQCMAAMGSLGKIDIHSNL